MKTNEAAFATHSQCGLSANTVIKAPTAHSGQSGVKPDDHHPGHLVIRLQKAPSTASEDSS